MAKDNELEAFSNPSGTLITSQETDAIGEILNISMGSAATAVSTMLDKQVVITTPQVTVRKFQMINLAAWEPAMLVRVKYVEGISGTNLMVFHKHDVQMILNLLMGIDEEPSDDFEFDELSMSAVCEVMNMMMGSSATALSSFFGEKIDISTPEANILETEDQFREIISINAEDDIVCISFKMTIEGVLNTEFINMMPCELAKTLAVRALGDSEIMAETPPPVQQTPPPVQQAPPPVQQAPPPVQQAPPPVQQAPPPVQPQMEMQPQMQPQPQMQMQPQMQPQPQMQMQPQMQAQPQMQMQPQMQPQGNVIRPDYVQTPQFPDFAHRTDTASIPLNSNMDIMMGLPLTVSVEIGKTAKKIKDIMEFTQGTIIELEKQAGAPVDIVVNGQLIARGDVVVIDDNFGVRITEIIRTKDLKI